MRAREHGCAQGLLQTDSWAAELIRQSAEDLGVHVTVAPVERETVSKEDVEVNRSQAGEVLLF